MKRMRSNDSGFILMIVMVFIMIMLISVYALYTLIFPNHNIMMNVAANAEGHYAAMAGLRYAAIMLRDPNVITDITNNDGSYVWSIKNDYPDLYTDLRLHGANDVSIIITKNDNGTYTTTASYD